MNPIKLDFSSDIYQFGEDISAARLHAKLFNVISSKINIIVNTEGNKKLDRIGFTKSFKSFILIINIKLQHHLGMMAKILNR